jgi:hypothetical protein
MEASVSASEPTGANAIIPEPHGDHLMIIRIDRPQRRNGFDSTTPQQVARYQLKVCQAGEDIGTLSLQWAKETRTVAAHALEAVVDAYGKTTTCAAPSSPDIVFSSGQDLIAAATNAVPQLVTEPTEFAKLSIKLSIFSPTSV